MITSLRCRHFKCFKDTGTVRLAPITLLVGENNSGKSSLLQALHIAALTLQSEDPSISLRLVHEDYDYGTFRDLAYSHDEGSHLELSYGCRATLRSDNEAEGARKIISVTMHLTFGFLRRRKEIYLHRFAVEDHEGERMAVVPAKYKRSQNVVIRGHEEKGRFLSRWFQRRNFVFQPTKDPLTTYLQLQRKYGQEAAAEFFQALYIDMQLIGEITTSLRNVHHLGPLRVPPRRVYHHSGEFAKRLGARGELALQNYARLRRRGTKEDIETAEAIDNALYRLGFIKQFALKRLGGLGGRHQEFRTQHASSSLEASLADTGFGASQVLPVLISLFTAEPGATLMYEQPELHLHPAAQAELGSIFAQVASDDKRLVIETHSESLILRLMTEVAKGALKPEDIAVYYALPKKQGHELRLLPLSKDGQFLAEWPKGFFEETYREALELSRCRGRKGGR
ncbi:DUF3696 domain-containing protein [Planctomycetota bacterium]